MKRFLFTLILILSLSGDSFSVQEQITLRDYVDVKMGASEKAVGIASENLQRELVKLNDLRQEVTRDRSLLVTKDKYEGDIGAIRKDIQEMRERFSSMEARFTTWISAIGIFFVVVQILINYFNRRALKRDEK